MQPIGRTTISTNQSSQSSQGLNYQPKNTHGGTHGSSDICSRGWLCWTSKAGEALGSEKARCPSIGECQDREVGVGALMSRGKEVQVRGFSEGKPGKEITFEM